MFWRKMSEAVRAPVSSVDETNFLHASKTNVFESIDEFLSDVRGVFWRVGLIRLSSTEAYLAFEVLPT